MALCPRLIAAGSPGTIWVTVKEIRVIPSINSKPIAILFTINWKRSEPVPADILVSAGTGSITSLIKVMRPLL